MEILAINKGHRDPDHDNFSDYLYSFGGFAISLFILVMSCRTWLISTPPAQLFALALLTPALFHLFIGLIYLDNYLRWNHATETISVQHETLVIDCHGCIFPRRKEIPLSTIKCVEPDNGHVLWLWSSLPDTLCVVYSNSHRYRFGICMTDTNRDALSKKITDLTKRYL